MYKKRNILLFNVFISAIFAVTLLVAEEPHDYGYHHVIGESDQHVTRKAVERF